MADLEPVRRLASPGGAVRRRGSDREQTLGTAAAKENLPVNEYVDREIGKAIDALVAK